MRVDLPLEERDLPQVPVEKDHTSSLADPVVRIMLYTVLGLVILALATVLGVVTTGVTEHTSPRTRAEKELVLASGSVTSATKGEDLAPYVDAQIAAGDWTGARATLARARVGASSNKPMPALDLAEARMAEAKGDSEGAVRWADKAMKGYRVDFQTRVAAAKAADKNTGQVRLRGDYYNAVLVKAYGLEELGRWKDAIKMFDIYLQTSTTASDIFIDRGYAKIEVSDKAGAEKDFRQALKFVPYDERAKSGLKKIGAAK